MKKKRLDHLLVEKKLFSSRQKAIAQIMAGNVLVNDEPATKAGALISPQSIIRIRNESKEYVSRGAYKLLKALNEFDLNVEDQVAMDIGSSTGGFSQVLLERGIRKIYAIDVGTNQLDYKIRKDERVVVLENTNARYLKKDSINDPIDFVVMDVSFISILKIIPNLSEIVQTKAQWVTLIKPQFEAGREKVEKGGIVRDPQVHQEVIKKTTLSMEQIGFHRAGLIESPIQGTQGNTEFLAWWKRS